MSSSLQGWIAQAWEWDTIAQYGALVTVSLGIRTVIGVVYQINTGSIDAHRRPTTFQLNPEQLRREQPHVFNLLKTDLSCLCLGYLEKSDFFAVTPPEPVHIHEWVSHATVATMRCIFREKTFLPLLFGAAVHIGDVSELLLAMLAHYRTQCGLQREELKNTAYAVAEFMGNDYQRLRLFIQRAEKLVPVV